MTAPARRLPAVIAGCFAIAASLTTMGVIVVSDIAEARESSELSTLSDELPEVPQVKVAPRRVAVEPDLTLFLLNQFGETEEEQKAASGISPPVSPKKSKKKRVNFGAFEGY